MPDNIQARNLKSFGHTELGSGGVDVHGPATFHGVVNGAVGQSSPIWVGAGAPTATNPLNPNQGDIYIRNDVSAATPVTYGAVDAFGFSFAVGVQNATLFTTSINQAGSQAAATTTESAGHNHAGGAGESNTHTHAYSQPTSSAINVGTSLGVSGHNYIDGFTTIISITLAHIYYCTVGGNPATWVPIA